MKIKSIKPTNKFAHIKFEEIIKDPINKKVYTPNGFQPVLACEKIKTGPTVKIKTEVGEIICDPHHRFLVDNGISFAYGNIRKSVRFAQDLLPTDKLIGYDNKLLDFTTEPGSITDLYDIQLPNPHWWYTAGVISHNSILLCNNAVSSLKGMGPGNVPGQNVLLVTFELDAFKTAMRCLAAGTNLPIDELLQHQEMATRIVNSMRDTYKKRFHIHELPPDECSVDHIYNLLARLKRHDGWKPDVIIIDYMDLMMSRIKKYNDKEYDRQKHVATEIRGLAKNENVLVFTATQTNRSGMEGGLTDLNKAAESFGKQFALDYIISLNQSIDERTSVPSQLRFFVAKNRNGPKHETITCEINYKTMVVRESKIQSTAAYIENQPKAKAKKSQ